MPLLLTEDDVAEMLTMPDCIAAVEAAFRRQAAGDVLNHPRRGLHVPAGTFHFMEAADLGLGRAAIKAYASFRPHTRFLILLYDTSNGDLLAMIEADRLGQMRTGAATGVATRYMAREDARVLGLFGSGWQAESQAMAVAAARPLARVQVYSRTRARREAFAERVALQLGIEADAVEMPEQCVEGADIVVTATTARAPLFDGTLLAAGTHVNAVGSNSLAKAEVDVETARRAGVVAADSLEQAKQEAGDLLAPAEARRFRWEQAVPLADIVSGLRPGRHTAEEITLFKSLGVALEDVAAASLVYDRALAEGRGREVRLWE